MKPSQVATRLRHIATAIDNSNKPDKTLVIAALRKTLASMRVAYRMSMTFGNLPTREQYDAAWNELASEGELRDGLFHFGNDSRMGDAALTQDELWTEIENAYNEYGTEYESDDTTGESAGDWLSMVLDILGFEWV